MYIPMSAIFLMFIAWVVGNAFLKARDERQAGHMRRIQDAHEAERSNRMERAGRAVRLKQFAPSTYAECAKLFTPKELAEHLSLLPSGQYLECLNDLHHPEDFAARLKLIVRSSTTHS
jgi:hypothetical protein